MSKTIREPAPVAAVSKRGDLLTKGLNRWVAPCQNQSGIESWQQVPTGCAFFEVGPPQNEASPLVFLLKPHETGTLQKRDFPFVGFGSIFSSAMQRTDINLLPKKPKRKNTGTILPVKSSCCGLIGILLLTKL